ncbi:hypothetical protein BP6252_04195 [Coleophoma cylindrospora]|uniref:FHA domain-containing protein n=1 Tax=Coleophoma cylindrospora TaxID=1849047 RepID=A0A3D8RZS6_9HELO|nr:hypothetical protein BP6252_04195 [Coleophoma cylindrospora]
MDSSPSKVNALPALPSTTSGAKRPAPSLLPAFEPLSSSPGFRPSKRRAYSPPSEREPAYQKYPTPIPTSTTGILSSSPPRVQIQSNRRRAGLHRTHSSVSERAPLSAVPSVVLPDDGSELLMGRSSNSSHYQLSANRLISRVHIKARYIAATVPLEPNKVEIICRGWNGAKLHCQGRTWELSKGDSFTSETENAEIMLDVQDARVLLIWPNNERKHSIAALAEDSWDEESSPGSRNTAHDSRGQLIHSSPSRRDHHIRSPVSPTPAGVATTTTDLSGLITNGGEDTFVQVYEDDHSEEDPASSVKEDEPPSSCRQVVSSPFDFSASQSSELSDPEEEDPDEENDPLVHSFGPFGANLTSHMASFTAGSPSPKASRHRPALSRSSSESTNEADAIPIVNHVVNQLAFSRLSSTPLSVIMNNLPADLKGVSSTHLENRGLTKHELRKMLNAARCIGEIHREGKDAAGKPLESEYYYIPDEDQDEQRRAAVVDGLRKPSLRNCRKQHKQYYWKRPRTP